MVVSVAPVSQVLQDAAQARIDLLSGFAEQDLAMVESQGKQVYIFGYAKDMLHLGTEILGLASVKATMEKSGRRFCAYTRFDKLSIFLTRKLDLTVAPRVNQMNKYIANATQGDLDEMLVAGVIWNHCIVEELSLIYVLTGWYVFEKPLSGAVIGVHVACLPATLMSLESLEALVA
jgi:hypothetical protein